MAVMPGEKCIGKCIIFMWLGTFVFFIALMSSTWSDHKNGYATLWKDCKFLNTTDANGNQQINCRTSTMEGPGWLKACRTMASFVIVFLALVFYFYTQWGILQNQTTFKGQVMARMPSNCYFISGSLMLTTGILYHLNFKHYYSEIREQTDVRADFGVLVAYIGGTLHMSNAIFLSTSHDTGLKRYLQSKFTCCKSKVETNSNQQSDRSDAVQPVEVKSRFTFFTAAWEGCGKLCKKKNKDDDNNNNGVGQVMSRDGATQTQFDLPRMELGGNDALAAFPPPQNRNRNEMREVPPELKMNVFVVGLDTGLTTRSGSQVSMSHLHVSVQSLSEADGINGLRANAVGQQDTTLGQSSSEENESRSNSGALSYYNHEYDPDQAPPSYEEVMHEMSNC